MGFFDSSSSSTQKIDYVERDPYKPFAGRYGGKEKQLLDYFEAMMNPDSPQGRRRFGMGERMINQAADRRREGLMRDLSKRGLASSGAARQTMLDVEGQRSQAMRDMMTKIMSNPQIGGMFSNYLANMYKSPIFQQSKITTKGTARESGFGNIMSALTSIGGFASGIAALTDSGGNPSGAPSGSGGSSGGSSGGGYTPSGNDLYNNIYGGGGFGGQGTLSDLPSFR